MQRIIVGAIAALAAGLLCINLASAKAPVTVNVKLTEFKVELSNTELPAGTPVTFVITNDGKVTHEMVLEKANAVDEPLEFEGKAQEAEDIVPGTTRTVEWIVPDAGTYQLACHVSGHFESGMKTQFTTAAAPAAVQATANLPKTGENGSLWPVVLGCAGLLALGGGLALRRSRS